MLSLEKRFPFFEHKVCSYISNTDLSRLQVFAWRLQVFTIPSSFPVFVSFSPVLFRIFIEYIFSLTPHFLPSHRRILSKFSEIASVVGI